MQKLLSLSILLMLLAGWACTQEEDATIVVTTEEIIFVSGEKVRALGRLITNQPVSTTDHGFQLSTSENFTSPIIVSLGLKDGPGRFIGETDGLSINQTYFVKAFATVDGVDIFGETIELKTLSPALDSFSPTFGKFGEEVVIQGRNFPAGTRVFFGDQEATVLQNFFESRLRVRIPESQGEILVKVSVQVKDEILEFSQNFEYQSGSYTLIGQFPEVDRIYGNVSFLNESGFHVGLGSKRLGIGPYEGFQRFNPQTGTWSKVSFPSQSREGAFATSNFLGGGGIEISRDVFSFKRDFRKINGSTFTQLPDLPTNSLNSVAFELNGQLYLAGGLGVGAQNIMKYNPSTQAWTTQSEAPIAISNELASFVYQNKAYFVASDNNVWEYEPNTDSWRIVTSYPGPLGNGFGIAQVIGDKVYIGWYRRTEQAFELDLTSLTWKSKNSIPGLPQSINTGSFTFEGQIYILRSPEEPISGSLPIELYRFEPNGI